MIATLRMKLSRLWWLLLLVLAQADAAPPKRIVSLYPHATEIVAALDANRLIAIDGASNFPPQVQHLSRIQAYPEPSIEALLALRPDLVITWTRQHQAKLAKRLFRYGINVVAIEPEKPADVSVEIRKLGLLLGLEKQADWVAADYERRLRALQQHYAAKKRVKVFLQISEKPLMTVSERSFLGKAIDDCGADNAFATQPAVVPLVSLEAVLVYGPEIIIGTSGQTSLAHWHRYKWLPAVRDDQLYAVTRDELMRPGPRLPEGMEMLCRLIDQARMAKMP